ncbi:MAG: hypothetical protein NVSMB47_13790 [Polyangiales bacterium]
MSNRTVRWMTTMTAAMIVAGCGAGAPIAAATSGTKKPEPPFPTESVTTAVARELAGTWTMRQQGQGLVGHEDVPLTIDVEGSHVMGHFAADQGTIDGELKGNDVIGSWKESDGEGDFVWHLSSDGKTFDGKFTGMLHSRQVPEGARWSGVRK